MNSFSADANYIQKLAEISNSNNGITAPMYHEHQVYRGLRDLDGNGVVTGLTEISRSKAKDKDEFGNVISCPGELYYRGIDINSLVGGFMEENRFGFEETVYLLLTSDLPNSKELSNFYAALSQMRHLPDGFIKNMIMRMPGKDIMNILSRCVLGLYAYDENPDDISIPNVLRQCLYLISVFPLLSIYGYLAHSAEVRTDAKIIEPRSDFSTAQNMLYLLRGNDDFSDLEAKILDLALVLHAEHGGGNNSSFTTHVVTSSGTDTYSVISAALGSLKGPRHGGANIKVVKMFEDMKQSINIKDDGAIKDHLVKLLNKQAFDNAGLIYGMGHAVYSLSDPRADILKSFAKSLSVEKGFTEEYELYRKVAKFAPEIIAEKRKIYKGVSANVDFYSGLIYRMLELPSELFTPIFAISRVAGWSAHRIEEIQNTGKIIRPAYIGVKQDKEYVKLYERK